MSMSIFLVCVTCVLYACVCACECVCPSVSVRVCACATQCLYRLQNIHKSNLKIINIDLYIYI